MADGIYSICSDNAATNIIYSGCFSYSNFDLPIGVEFCRSNHIDMGFRIPFRFRHPIEQWQGGLCRRCKFTPASKTYERLADQLQECCRVRLRL